MRTIGKTKNYLTNLQLKPIPIRPNKNKIALTGKMRSGKDTVASHFFSEGYWPVAFGDQVKHYYKQIFGNYSEEEKPRRNIQKFGQYMRAIDDDVWVNKTLETINFLENEKRINGFIITDLRQPNEYNALVNEGYTIIRINTSENTRIARMERLGDVYTTEDLYHETEQYVDIYPVHYDVYNNGTLDGLKSQVEKILTNLT